MRFILFLCSVFLSIPVIGQIDTVHAFTYGGLEEEFGEKVIEVDGDYWMFGNTSSFGRGNTSIYVVKTDESFQVINSKAFGGYDIQRMTDVIYSDGYFTICGFTNENEGVYYGKIWKMDTAFEIQSVADIAYSNGTFPTNILAVNGVTIVTGTYGLIDKTVFISAFDSNFEMTQWLSFESEELSEVASLNYFDELLVLGTSRQEQEDSSGVIIRFDTFLSSVQSFQLPDSLGYPKSILKTANNEYIVGGHCLIDSISGDNRVQNIWKIDTQFLNVEWRAVFPFAEASSSGTLLAELDNGRVLLAGITDYQFYLGNYGIVVSELDSNGNLISGRRSIYGWTGAEIPKNIINTSGDSVLIFGSTNSYGAGNYDMYGLLLPVRSTMYNYQETFYVDDLEKIVSVSELNDLNSIPCDLISELVGNLQGSNCGEIEVDVFNTMGQLILSRRRLKDISINELPKGMLIIQSDAKAEKLLVY
jgi:hypothetical protein